jgi:glutamyl-tRNA synthetase
MSDTKIVTRFAPSPTGLLHVGSVRTMLFNYLFAKKHGGKFILRIEDTDKERSKKEHEEYIYESMKWLDIEADETYVQSERTDIYINYIDKLIAEGKAYVSKEKNEETGVERELIRFRNPKTKVTFNDIIRGDISFETEELGDFIIARTRTEPLYHFVVVVDDFEMGVTHVIRGEDHISNTPRQILIQEAIGAPRPAYAHLPLILAEDRSKLSKRKHGELVATLHYRDNGYIADAFVNFLCLLGWNPGTDQEHFTREDLIDQFTLERINKAGAIFDVTKLRHVNKEHMLKLTPTVLEHTLRSWIEKGSMVRGMTIASDQYAPIAAILKDRISVFGDVVEEFSSGEFDFLMSDDSCPAYKLDPASIPWKKSTPEKAVEHLRFAESALGELPDGAFTAEHVKSTLWPYAEEHGKGDVLWPIRYSLSGKQSSPDPITLITLLGKTETLKRIRNAITKLGA